MLLSITSKSCLVHHISSHLLILDVNIIEDLRKYGIILSISLIYNLTVSIGHYRIELASFVFHGNVIGSVLIVGGVAFTLIAINWHRLLFWLLEMGGAQIGGAKVGLELL